MIFLHQPTILLVLGAVSLINGLLLAAAAALGASRRPALLFAAGSVLIVLPAWAMQDSPGLSLELRLIVFNVPALVSHALWLAGALLLFERSVYWGRLILFTGAVAFAVYWLTSVAPDREWRVFIVCVGYVLLRGMTAAVVLLHADHINRPLARLFGALMGIEAIIFLHRALTGLAGLVPSIDAAPFSEQVPAWVLLLMTSVIGAPLLLLLLLSRNISDLRQLSRRLSSTLRAMPDLVLELDQAGRYCAFHTNRSELLAAPPNEFLGRHPEDVLPPDVIAVQRAAMAEVDRTGRAEGYQYPLSLPGGEHWFDVCAAAVENPDGDSTGSASHGYVFVIRDITQRKRDERLKHEFISVVSHELRTPLTSIRGALAALSSGVLTNRPERSQEMLTIAQRNERHLAALIDDLLDMDKLLAGTMELNLQPQHLPKLLGSATEASIRAVNAAGLELKIAKPVPELRVLVDTARFTQILDNLVSNAIKASAHSERSEIVLSARRVADRVQLSVRDHGPGVAESLVPELYEPFTVLDGSTTRASGGTGMGLAIVRRLLDRMGGSINYADADGGGAVFTIELPLYTDPESTS